MKRSAMLGVLVLLSVTGLPACTPHGVQADLAAERAYPLRRNTPLNKPVQAQASRMGMVPAVLRPDVNSTTPPVARTISGAPPLSPGDRLRVEIHLLDDLSGIYDVDVDGTLHIPHLDPLQVAGATAADASVLLRAALLDRQYLRPELAHVSVEVQQWAPVQVMVEGAVFSPGTVTVNVRDPDEKAQKSLQVSGDFPGDRMLPAALRSAGGVRMDAELSRVQLVRGGQVYTISLVDAIEGGQVMFTPLIAGDRIIVPSSGHINERLARPSAITPPGIRVFLSNQTTPVGSNSQAGIGRDATSLPYGSTLLTGLISANCVGGTAMTNSARWAVLMTRNPLTGEPHTVERAIEDLLRTPHDADLNPSLQPEDGIACYDSGVTNLRDVARTIGDLLVPWAVFF